MENASKALIIAGAILLAIVIISLGLIVVNNVRNVTDNTNLSEQQIQSFNAKFTAYEGDNVSGSRVNSLIQQVISTNQATYSDGNNNFVTICYHPSNWARSYIFLTFKNGGIKATKAGGSSIDFMTSTAELIASVRDNGNDGGIDYDFNSYIPDGGTVTANSSVTIGKNYKVRCFYKDGLVKCIIVQDN